MQRREFLTMLSVGATGTFIPWHGAQAKIAPLQSYLRTNWSRDPYSFGAYSYVAKGALQSDRITLGAPIQNRIYFAGEAVHPKQNSTVHAAYESGVSAAHKVRRSNIERIAIIGAGISGLAAAKILSDNAKSVTVFEARSRIGGRIWTDNSLGVPLDIGASWIHGTRRNPLTNLARQTNTQTIVTDDSFIIRGKGGRNIKEENAPDWLENVVSIQHDAGADSSEINLDAYFAQDEFGGPDVILPTGYESILSVFRGNYTIKNSEKVTMVSHNENGVEITSSNGKATFDAVIVTLPLGVLKKGVVTFKPALPEAKQQAIERLGMGTLDKLYLVFNEPFWDKDITWILTPENGLPRGHFNQWLNLYKYLNLPIILAFNGGPPAIELSDMPDEVIVERALTSLIKSYS
ncbi:MAG: FAD-dependent oxidoreductase [Devosiaceae bacterium]|nr:FAD-dependent oxidoreductase [Devosiaceae bacterium]